MKKNALYAQSGGVTAVINASACGVIETAKKHFPHINKIFAARNGIIGVFEKDLIDLTNEASENIKKLKFTPAGAFGSCRYKLKDINSDESEYEKIIEIFKEYNIGYFFYNGGGDSQDTAYKISKISEKMGYPIICIGVPKTIDNDLPFTDCCPGFGSVAKYVAISIQEAGLDVASMAKSSTKVFILEVMGRHAGWIAAASGLAQQKEGQAPHIILFPEIIFDPKKFIQEVDNCVKKYGFCAIVASEGIKDDSNKFIAESGLKDSFGHAQLGGVAPVLANLIKSELNLKYHYAISDYLQRSARHIASQTDLDQAYELGKAAVELAIAGKNSLMPTIKRLSDEPYKWEISQVELSKVAAQEKFMPRDYISESGFHITEKAKKYLLPLIQGEAYPPYKNGLPDYDYSSSNW